MKQQNKKPRTAITPTREDDFPGWYQSVIREADLAENSPVRGCMIIKPYGFALWENIKGALDAMIKEEGVQNAYFPLLIPLEFISREAEHIDGFAKECAVVTHHRLEKDENGKLVPAPDAKLEEPYVVRPTSETIIGDSMARWIQSYRDLPLKLNQWCNVMRWEMRTRMFLRTSEFLWQEGHNAFATADEAWEDTMKMIRIYERLFRDYMAMDGVAGEKTADERFPGADRSVTYEAMMQDGKALQACTSHNLGQNFAKSCGISFQGEDGQEHLAYTTSWGLSTRSVGGLIMSHSDDDGLILPPKVAPHQVGIIPVLRDESGAGQVMDSCVSLAAQLKAQGVSSEIDRSDRRTPDKMWGSIKKGVPVRVEIGQREVENGELTFVLRNLGRDSKETVAVDAFVKRASTILEEMQTRLLKASESFTRDRIKDVSSLADAQTFFEEDQRGFVRMDTSLLAEDAFLKIASDHAVTPRCLPFEDEGQKVVIGKSY